MSYEQQHFQSQQQLKNSAALKPPVRPAYSSEDFNGSDYVCMTGASGIKNRPEMNTAVSRTTPKSRPLDVPVMANIAISNSTAIGSPKHHTSMASTTATTPSSQMRYGGGGGEVREESSNDHHTQSRNTSTSLAISPTPSQTSLNSAKSGNITFV